MQNQGIMIKLHLFPFSTARGPRATFWPSGSFGGPRTAVFPESLEKRWSFGPNFMCIIWTQKIFLFFLFAMLGLLGQDTFISHQGPSKYDCQILFPQICPPFLFAFLGLLWQQTFIWDHSTQLHQRTFLLLFLAACRSWMSATRSSPSRTTPTWDSRCCPASGRRKKKKPRRWARRPSFRWDQVASSSVQCFSVIVTTDIVTILPQNDWFENCTVFS